MYNGREWCSLRDIEKILQDLGYNSTIDELDLIVIELYGSPLYRDMDLEEAVRRIAQNID